MSYYYLATALILLVQVALLAEGYRHLVFTARKYRPKRSSYQPRVALISPCKGIDTTFDRNIQALFALDYPSYAIYFVVESETDPAYGRLAALIAAREGKGPRAHLLVAGPAHGRSQKVHNSLVACDAVHETIEVLAFVDSDACPKPHFLRSLVHPLRRREVGASTGYRWFVPEDKSLSSWVLSALNAVVGSLMGPHRWNSAWGGAMAIKQDLFYRLGVHARWGRACTDDYPLTSMVKAAGLAVTFVPACFVASYEKTTWRDLYSFARRQFILTRVYNKGLWWVALAGWGHYVLGFWGGLFLTVLLGSRGSSQAWGAAVLPLGLYAAGMIKAAARQVMIGKALPEDRRRLLGPAVLDVFFGPFVAAFALATVLGAARSRTIVWRGITYYMKDDSHTRILRGQLDS